MIIAVELPAHREHFGEDGLGSVYVTFGAQQHTQVIQSQRRLRVLVAEELPPVGQRFAQQRFRFSEAASKSYSAGGNIVAGSRGGVCSGAVRPTAKALDSFPSWIILSCNE